MGYARIPGTVGLGATATPPATRQSTRTVSIAARATSVTVTGSRALTAEQEELLLDIGQIVLDVVGIFEPTPFADTTNAVVSAFRSDWTGAGLSLVGVIPYIGDTAKAGKFPKYLKTVEKAVIEAEKNACFASILRPVLTKLYCALDALPIRSLPGSVRTSINTIRRRIADFVGPPARAARARRLITKVKSIVIDPDGVLDTIEGAIERGSALKGDLPVDEFLSDILRYSDDFNAKPVLELTDAPLRVGRASSGNIPRKASDKWREGLGKEEDWTIAQSDIDDELRAFDQGTYSVDLAALKSGGSDLSEIADRQKFALNPEWKNTMASVEYQEIPPRSILLTGKAKAQEFTTDGGKQIVHLEGGGEQIAHLAQLDEGFVLRKAADRTILPGGGTRLLGGKIIETPH